MGLYCEMLQSCPPLPSRRAPPPVVGPAKTPNGSATFGPRAGRLRARGRYRPRSCLPIQEFEKRGYADDGSPAEFRYLNSAFGNELVKKCAADAERNTGFTRRAAEPLSKWQRRLIRAALNVHASSHVGSHPG